MRWIGPVFVELTAWYRSWLIRSNCSLSSGQLIRRIFGTGGRPFLWLVFLSFVRYSISGSSLTVIRMFLNCKNWLTRVLWMLACIKSSSVTNKVPNNCAKRTVFGGCYENTSPPPPPPSSGEYNRFLRVTADVSTRSFPTRCFECCDFQCLKILKKKTLQNLD